MSATIIQHWDSVDHLAAKARLNLAQRLQHEYDRLDAEFANLRRSQSWLAGQDDSESARIQIAYMQTLAPYLRQRGLNAELLSWCMNGSRACERLQQNPGWLLLLRSEAQSALGKWNEAIADIQAAIDASQDADPITHARAMLALGRLQLNRGDYRSAFEMLANAEPMLTAQSDHEGLIVIQVERAAYHLNRGELDEALTLYLKADQLRREAGADEATDHTLLMLGVVYRKKRDYSRATEYLQQLLERGEARQNPATTATAAHHIAWVHLNQGNLALAHRFCGQALALYEEIGDLRGASDAYEQLGVVHLALRHKDEALSYLKRSLTMRRQLGNQEGAAASLRRLAIVHMRMGHVGRALHHLLQSLATYQRLGVLSLRRLATILVEFWKWGLRRRWTR